MSYTPLVRWRNFKVENLKTILNIIPDLPQDLSRRDMVDKIEENMPGYKKTVYQFACQLGIECRGEKFKIQNYLYALNDQGLEMYLKFWFKNYVTPNPYIKADASIIPINIYYELGREILYSDSLSIEYENFLKEKFGDMGSMDILTNAIKTLADPIKVNDGKAYIEKNDRDILEYNMNKVNKYLPKKLEHEEEYFNRFSYMRFKEFYDLNKSRMESVLKPINLFSSELKLDFVKNKIVFGAPGTGKSYALNKNKDILLQDGGEYERVTFHPDYSYSEFIGCYKPVQVDSDDKNESNDTQSGLDSNNPDSGKTSLITYEFVPGPFTRVLSRALENCIDVNEDQSKKPEPFLLIIEEINRANTAAVFGDIFQLLDRKDGISEYGINPSEDIKKYLSRELKIPVESINEIRIPNNMFIWATMNSADQGVFPMDTAFKRRWDFEYIGINENEDVIKGLSVNLSGKLVNWNVLRQSINNWLVSENINEDKLLGPFFINCNSIKKRSSNILDEHEFKTIFKNKVLMYLYEDAARYKKEIFRDGKNNILLSTVFKNFDERGIEVFNDEIVEKYNELSKDAVGNVYDSENNDHYMTQTLKAAETKYEI